ncbi:hypothetical protein H1C71_011933 [Ictidomys tridecemlineatus]|nr:hypothetical protein H1C71_011933 [Ictidomys tridecemlineatus]
MTAIKKTLSSLSLNFFKKLNCEKHHEENENISHSLEENFCKTHMLKAWNSKYTKKYFKLLHNKTNSPVTSWAKDLDRFLNKKIYRQQISHRKTVPHPISSGKFKLKQ